MTTVDSIADYFIALSNETQDPITNLKLQKLVYYVQAWHLAAFEKPAFDAEFQAWVHGPVVPDLYHKYKDRGFQPINEEKPTTEEIRKSLTDSVNEILDDVVEEYFPRGAFELERLTHSEDPWISARGGIPADATSTAVITNDSMKNYYKAYLITDNE